MRNAFFVGLIATLSTGTLFLFGVPPHFSFIMSVVVASLFIDPLKQNK